MGRNMKRLIIIVASLVVLAAAALMYEAMKDRASGPPEATANVGGQGAAPADVAGAGASGGDDSAKPTESDAAKAPAMLERFKSLYEQNNDFVGWIRVPNTAINYPVVYCSDNKYYLNHDFLKRPTTAGTPFLDMRADLLVHNQSLSTYGHYMGNGKMYNDLHKYKSLDYYKANPVFVFDSLYEEGVYKIFAVLYMAGNASDKLFYNYMTASFDSDAAFMEHVNQLRERSIFNTGVDVAPGDQLVLMTVCTYETDNLRLVVAGRKVRPDESYEVDTANAILNPDPLYPQKWYDAKGGKP